MLEILNAEYIYVLKYWKTKYGSTKTNYTRFRKYKIQSENAEHTKYRGRCRKRKIQKIPYPKNTNKAKLKKYK